MFLITVLFVIFMAKYVTQQSYDVHSMAAQDAVNFEPSITQPDESMTVKEILARYTRGMDVNLNVHDGGVSDDFDEDDDLCYLDLSKLDYVELDNLRTRVQSRINEIESANAGQTSGDEQSSLAGGASGSAADEEVVTELGGE